MDEELKLELLDSFNDIYEDVEVCLTDIRINPTTEMLNHLFRSVHNAKGNAGMMGLENIVSYTHAIEELAGAIRAKRFPCSSTLSEIIQICMDRLKDLHYRDVLGKPFDNLQEAETIKQLQALALSDEASVETHAKTLLQYLGGDLCDSKLTATGDTSPAGKDEKPNADLDENQREQDLLFFQELSLQIDGQSEHWEGRSIQLFDWAMKVNHIGGKPVSYAQFAAAIYLHDLGMSFLPTQLIDKNAHFSEDERHMLRMHPNWGYGLLTRMPGWEEAAQIILDHHEWINGEGYPTGKKGDDIHIGAKILAILDAFFSITRGRADRDVRRTVMRAISEINNASGSQFDPLWVQHFNTMVRQELHAGLL